MARNWVHSVRTYLHRTTKVGSQNAATSCGFPRLGAVQMPCGKKVVRGIRLPGISPVRGERLAEALLPNDAAKAAKCDPVAGALRGCPSGIPSAQTRLGPLRNKPGTLTTPAGTALKALEAHPHGVWRKAGNPENKTILPAMPAPKRCLASATPLRRGVAMRSPKHCLAWDARRSPQIAFCGCCWRRFAR